MYALVNNKPWVPCRLATLISAMKALGYVDKTQVWLVHRHHTFPVVASSSCRLSYLYAMFVKKKGLSMLVIEESSMVNWHRKSKQTKWNHQIAHDLIQSLKGQN